jgi:hypothetical protein
MRILTKFVTVHKMDNVDEFYFLDSPLLKILLLTERSKHMNEVFASRGTYGEYHTISHELLSQQNKRQFLYWFIPLRVSGYRSGGPGLDSRRF